MRRGDLVDPLPAAGDDLEAQVTTPDGRILAATDDLETRRPIGVLPRGATTRWASIDGLPGDDDEDDDEDDDPYRVLSRRAEGPDGTVVVHVAADLEDVRESTAALTRSLLVGIPTVTVLLAVVVWYLVGRTLRPVAAIRREVDAIGAGALERRVPEPPGRDEIAQLARTMNAMLARVEHAHDEQQRFVADASHELRGPLTRIRSELEVDRAHPATADPEATGASVLAEVVGLKRLVDDLLVLARSDAGTLALRRDVVDLDDVVLREVARLRTETATAAPAGATSAAATVAAPTIDSAGVSGAQVRGDRDALTRLVRNLVDNAARHAASRVTVSLSERDGLAVLAVADDGPGIPPADRDRVFERFTRLDEARSAGTGGTGLGLAIVHDIADRHGGAVRVEDAPGGGARFVVDLPTGERAVAEGVAGARHDEGVPHERS